MQLSEVGELGIISRIRQLIGKGKNSLILGIGDDAAALKLVPDRILLLTTDTLVEGIHFDRKYISFQQLGWRALAVNLSDIAAMGGEPLYATVCLSLPQDLTWGNVEAFYQGMKELAEKYDVQIVGGDTVHSKTGMVISITVVGQVEEDNLVARSGAQVGDLICVTGDLGASRAGLEILKAKEKNPKYQRIIRKYQMPEPRIEEARTLVQNLPVHSMIDISDGLASEIHHICEASGVGAQIFKENIPIDPVVIEVAEFYGDSPVDYALKGGEDFELLFTVARTDEPIATDIMKDRIKIIGEIVAKEKGVYLIDRHGKTELKWAGYDHFKGRNCGGFYGFYSNRRTVAVEGDG